MYTDKHRDNINKKSNNKSKPQVSRDSRSSLQRPRQCGGSKAWYAILVRLTAQVLTFSVDAYNAWLGWYHWQYARWRRSFPPLTSWPPSAFSMCPSCPRSLEMLARVQLLETCIRTECPYVLLRCQ